MIAIEPLPVEENPPVAVKQKKKKNPPVAVKQKKENRLLTVSLTVFNQELQHENVCVIDSADLPARPDQSSQLSLSIHRSGCIVILTMNCSPACFAAYHPAGGTNSTLFLHKMSVSSSSGISSSSSSSSTVPHPPGAPPPSSPAGPSRSSFMSSLSCCSLLFVFVIFSLYVLCFVDSVFCCEWEWEWVPG